jgi:8-amino-7-oxononanoate synthase
MSDDPLERLRLRARQRVEDGLRRSVTPRDVTDPLLDLASNDYLGLARDHRVRQAAAAAADQWGAGSTGSRLVTGSTTLHARLEDDLARFVGAAAGLVFSSGYLANLGAIAALGGPDVLVVSDAFNHASVIDACRLSRSRVVVVDHRAVDQVAAALRARHEPHALVVTDSVFSVDGDLAPLAGLAETVRQHDALLVVDEAHALGVVGDGGRGAVAAAGLAGDPAVVVTVTLSKSLGSQGGAVLADSELIAHLVDTARTFIFDTALAPPAVGAALAALHVLRAEPELAVRARQHAAHLTRAAWALGLAVREPAAAVASIVIGDPRAAVAAQARCAEHGVRVGCFRPPSVPDGLSRVRLTARADLSQDDLDRAVHALQLIGGTAGGRHTVPT